MAIAESSAWVTAIIKGRSVRNEEHIMKVSL